MEAGLYGLGQTDDVGRREVSKDLVIQCHIRRKRGGGKREHASTQVSRVV